MKAQRLEEEFRPRAAGNADGRLLLHAGDGAFMSERHQLGLVFEIILGDDPVEAA